jgi:hypothetical protein
MVPAELAIREAIARVEEMGVHTLLTDAVILLSQAKDKVGSFVDLTIEDELPDTEEP